MADPIKIPFTVTDLKQVQPPLRVLYQPQADGTFHLQTEGDPPGFVTAERLEEFRSNNRSLNAAKTELEAKLKAFEGIDPVAAKAALGKPALDGKVTALETQLAAEKAARAAEQFKNLVAFDFLKLGGRPEAADYIAAQAGQVFTMQDGKLTTKQFSAKDPGVPLSVAEWMGAQLSTSAHLFLPSRGGGTPSRHGGGHGGSARKRVDLNDPLDVGKNLEAIAQGTVDFDR